MCVLCCLGRLVYRYLLCPFDAWCHFPLLFYYFWDCNTITSFLPSISSLHTPPYILPCSLSNSWALFPLIGCMYLCIFICMPTYNQLSLYNVTAIRADHGLGVLFPGEDCLPHSQQSSVACGSLYTVEGLVALPPLSFTHLPSFSSCLGRHIGETSSVQLMMVLGDTISQKTPCFILQSFCPLSAMFPET